MQLVAYGAQDIYLTGNPQITFFKVVYRRHTNFSIETIAQTFNSDVDFGKKSQVTIARNGDLISAMHLEIKLPQLKQVQSGSTYVSWTNGIGNALIKSVSIEIGGQEIDKHYGEWLDIWGELNVKKEHRDAYDAMVGNRYVSDDSDPQDATALHPLTLYVPLRFWFNRNIGLALPLIALQNHEVKLLLTLNGQDICHINSGTNISLWVDYIFLDKDERRRFARTSHQYLIEQLQRNEIKKKTENILNFNYPVKELIWKEGENNITDTNWTLNFNGKDRFIKRPTKYFTRTQVWQHHTGYGGVTIPDSIAVYSFSIKPESHQPTGVCNFTRIDEVKLLSDLELTNEGTIYAVNYNILKIMSGMAGVSYIN